MSLTKVVNGERVECSAEEEQAIRDAWGAGPSPAEWYHRIDARTRVEQQKPVSVALSDGNNHTVAMSDIAQIHMTAGALQADRAQRAGSAFTRHLPTAEGMIQVGPDDLLALIDAADQHVDACNVRRGELWEAVAAGTITEADLDSGWPA